MQLSLKKVSRLKAKSIVSKEAVINLIGKKSLNGSGSGGRYWKLNAAVGVKVPGKTSNIFAELAMLERLDRDVPGLFPKPYGLVTVQVGRAKRQAILMENIEGKPGYSTDDDVEIDESLDDQVSDSVQDVDAAKQRIEDAGYRWNDDHAGNIMRETKTGRVRFIDADPRYFSGIGNSGDDSSSNGDVDEIYNELKGA